MSARILWIKYIIEHSSPFCWLFKHFWRYKTCTKYIHIEVTLLTYSHGDPSSRLGVKTFSIPLDSFCRVIFRIDGTNLHANDYSNVVTVTKRSTVERQWKESALVLLVVVGPAGRPDHDQQHCYHHAPTVKPEAATAVVELLTMGVMTPETCWAVHTSKRQVVNLRNCCIWLVDLFER